MWQVLFTTSAERDILTLFSSGSLGDTDREVTGTRDYSKE